jgi:integrase
MSARNPNRASTVYLGNDGDWHGRVTMGFRDNGAPDRRHVRGKTKSEVVKKVRALERLRDEGAFSGPVSGGQLSPGLSTGSKILLAPVCEPPATTPIAQPFAST